MLRGIDPENPQNDQALEEMWAAKAFAYAETYERLLSVYKDLSKLKLTKIDDAIYEHFRAEFPDVDVANFDYDGSKTPENKAKWRKFCETYTDETVKDFNMATLIRVRASEPFGMDNSCIVPRVQFFAIEIARNREGPNEEYRKSLKE